MRVSDWFRWLFTAYRKPDAVTESVAILERVEKSLIARIAELNERHVDLVNHVGELQRKRAEIDRGHDKQLADLRAILANLNEQAKNAQPAVARSMADIRRFTGGDDE
jgi:uncharacterized coiled-coil DUF342 family protein